MTSPITRRLLRQAAEAEAPSYYPPKPERCAYKLVREESTSRYVGWCKRAGRQVIYSGHTALTRPLCWQHARMNLPAYAAAGVTAQIVVETLGDGTVPAEDRATDVTPGVTA